MFDLVVRVPPGEERHHHQVSPCQHLTVTETRKQTAVSTVQRMGDGSLMMVLQAISRQEEPTQLFVGLERLVGADLYE